MRTSDAPATEIEVVPSRLTLVTSDPAFTPDRTLIVSARARRQRAAGHDRLDRTAADQPGEGSSRPAASLLLWSQLLLLTTVVVTWAAHAVPGVGACGSAATPVLLAILWNVFENLALLLPNTL